MTVPQVPFGPVRFPPGLFSEGEQVKLRDPEDWRTSFEHPEQPLTIVGKYWFRMFEGPTYALAEPGGSGITRFRDADLLPV